MDTPRRHQDGQRISKDAIQATMEFQEKKAKRKRQKKWRPKEARFKMKLWFADGTTYPYYSYERMPNKRGKMTEREALQRLYTNVFMDAPKPVLTMTIFCKAGDNLETALQDYNHELLTEHRQDVHSRFKRKVKQMIRWDENGNLHTELLKQNVGSGQFINAPYVTKPK